MSNWYLQLTASKLGCQTARVQPTAPLPNREQQENSFGAAPEGCDPEQQNYCSALQNVCETWMFAAALHRWYCPHSLPCLLPAPQCIAVQEREWSTSISSQTLSGGEGLLCCQTPWGFALLLASLSPRAVGECSFPKSFSWRVEAHWANKSHLHTQTESHTGCKRMHHGEPFPSKTTTHISCTQVR